jgi:hypothetical protein
MKTLKLNEGDPLRVTGASLPKGKFVKLQAQESSFIEVRILHVLYNGLTFYRIGVRSQSGSRTSASKLYMFDSGRYY